MNIPFRCKIFDNNMMGDQLLLSALVKRDICDAKTMSALPPKADMCGATRDVRFVPKADIVASSACQLFDDLVGAGEHRRRECEAERLGGFEIDD